MLAVESILQVNLGLPNQIIRSNQIMIEYCHSEFRFHGKGDCQLHNSGQKQMGRVQLAKRMEIKHMLCFDHPTHLRTVFNNSKTSDRVWFSVSSVCAVFQCMQFSAYMFKGVTFLGMYALNRGPGATEKALQCSIAAWLAALSVKSGPSECSPPNRKHLWLLCSQRQETCLGPLCYSARFSIRK